MIFSLEIFQWQFVVGMDLCPATAVGSTVFRTSHNWRNLGNTLPLLSIQRKHVLLHIFNREVEATRKNPKFHDTNLKIAYLFIKCRMYS